MPEQSVYDAPRQLAGRAGRLDQAGALEATDSRRAERARDREPLPEPTGQTAQSRTPTIDVAVDKDIKRLIERSRAAQGLPPRITDPVVLARVAALVQAALGRKAARRQPASYHF